MPIENCLRENYYNTKLLVEVNQAKVERVLQEAAEQLQAQDREKEPFKK